MIKNLFKKVIEKFGYKLTRVNAFPPGSPNRPPYISFISVLEDMVARGFTSDYIFDIGANDGGWSRMVLPIFKNSKFFLIEPQIEMEESIASFCKENQGSSYFIGGVGSKTETSTLTIWDDKAGTSFIPAADETFDYASEKRQVKVSTIDSLIETFQLPIPNLVKLDIQGYELEALKGASSLFGKTEIFILEVAFFTFEGMPVFKDVIGFMFEKGYVVYDFAGFSRRPYDGALGQCDVVFAKIDGQFTTYQNWR